MQSQPKSTSLIAALQSGWALTRQPDFCQWRLSTAVFLHPYCPYLEEMSPYAQLYMPICTNVLPSVSVFILSSALVLSLSKGRNKYLSEIICC